MCGWLFSLKICTVNLIQRTEPVRCINTLVMYSAATNNFQIKRMSKAALCITVVLCVRFCLHYLVKLYVTIRKTNV